jgi:hypothetical protein
MICFKDEKTLRKSMFNEQLVIHPQTRGKELNVPLLSQVLGTPPQKKRQLSMDS